MKYAFTLLVLLLPQLGWSAVQRVNLVENSLGEPGSIVILAKQHKLYLIVSEHEAYVYPVAVAKKGLEWSGRTFIKQKNLRPDWAPPEVVKRAHPELPDLIPGGDPSNPMGAAALSLEQSEIAIHGTNAKMRKSIGSNASMGCIRMLNEDVVDLYDRVRVGTPVTMIAY